MATETVTIRARRIAHNGSWEVRAMVDGMLLSRTFYGYTRSESVALFREVVRCHGYGHLRTVDGGQA